MKTAGESGGERLSAKQQTSNENLANFGGDPAVTPRRRQR